MTETLTAAELAKLNTDQLYEYLYGKVVWDDLRVNMVKSKFGGREFPLAEFHIVTKPGKPTKKFTAGLTRANVSKFFKSQYDKDGFNTVAITFPTEYFGHQATKKFLNMLTEQFRKLLIEERTALGILYDPKSKNGPSAEDVVKDFIKTDMNGVKGLMGFYAAVGLRNVEGKDYGKVQIKLPNNTEASIDVMSKFKAICVPNKVAFIAKIHQGKATIRANLYSFFVENFLPDDRDDGTKVASLLMDNIDMKNIENVMASVKESNNKIDLSGLNNEKAPAKVPSPINDVIPQADVQSLRTD